MVVPGIFLCSSRGTQRSRLLATDFEFLFTAELMIKGERSAVAFGMDGKGAVEIYQEKRFLTVTGYEDLVESRMPFSSK